MKDFILKVLTVKRSQKLYNVQFALSDCVDCDLGYECIIRKVNISKKGINLKNILCTNASALETLLGFWILSKACSLRGSEETRGRGN